MKKLLLLILLSHIFLTGCASYKFNKGQSPYDGGFVVSRNGYGIVEYTLGYDESVPDDLQLAKQRFNRRRDNVEHFYKKMGFIESRFKQFLTDPIEFLSDFFLGIFKLPFMAVSDNRYETDKEYQLRIDNIERMIDEKESLRIKNIRADLAAYIQTDLLKEKEISVKKDKKVLKKHDPAKTKSKKVEQQVEVINLKTEKSIESVERTPVEEKKAIKAVIKANPTKGFGPLTVDFSGSGSYSTSGRIISYKWDFDDKTYSDKKNTKNTFYSGVFGSKYFTVTLTIEDSNGNIDASATTIEVINQ